MDVVFLDEGDYSTVLVETYQDTLTHVLQSSSASVMTHYQIK